MWNQVQVKLLQRFPVIEIINLTHSSVEPRPKCASACVRTLPCFLQVVASVNVHPLDHGPVWNLQGGQTHGKVRLPRQNNW